MAKQRLILLFDGTWNDPEDQTNVFRIAGRIVEHDGEIRQRFYYTRGWALRGWTASAGVFSDTD